MAKPFGEHQRVRVLIETAHRTYRGDIYKPVRDEALGVSRLSDHLNTYGKAFIALTDVEISEHGQDYPSENRRPFVAVAVAAVTHVEPLDGAD